MTLKELVEFLLGIGAVDAMNLDGGGSTSMYLDGKIINRPSDKEDGYPKRDHVKPAHLSFGKHILHRLRRKFDPHFDQRADCRRRPKVLAGGNDIDALLRGNLETPLELASRMQASEVTLEVEDRMLRAEVARIAQALYDSQRSSFGGNLARRLLALGEERRDAAVSTV